MDEIYENATPRGGGAYLNSLVDSAAKEEEVAAELAVELDSVRQTIYTAGGGGAKPKKKTQRESEKIKQYR